MIDKKYIKADHAEHFSEFNKQLSEINGIIAIFGFGSYFGIGFGPNSDVDILVLYRGKQCRKFKVNIQGLLFEVILLNFNLLNRMLMQGHKVFVPAICKGFLLYDSLGKAQSVISLAQNSYVSFAPKFDRKNRIEHSLSRANTILADMADAIGDLGLFELLLGQLIMCQHFMVCMHNNYWTHGVKHTLAELAQLLPEIMDLLTRCFRHDCNTTRLMLAKKIHDIVCESLNCKGLDVDSLLLTD